MGTVAEHDVVSTHAGDDVAAHSGGVRATAAADDDVRHRTARDLILAAVSLISGIEVAVGGRHRRAAVVAEDAVRNAFQTGVNRVIAGTTEDQVVTRGRGLIDQRTAERQGVTERQVVNLVVATELRLPGLHLNECARCIAVQISAVAEDEVVAAIAVDDVVAGAAHDGVRPGTALDTVRAAKRAILRVDVVHVGGHQIGLDERKTAGKHAVVADENVTFNRTATVNLIVTAATEDDVTTRETGLINDIVAAVGRVGSLHARHGQVACAPDVTVVAEDHVGAEAATQRVIAGAAKHEVIPKATVHDVIASDSRHSGGDVKRLAGVGRVHRIEPSNAIVADQNVGRRVERAAKDLVVARAAEDHICARRAGLVDHVVATRGLVERADDDNNRLTVARDVTAVTEDEVIAFATAQRIAAGAAENVVHAQTADDHVHAAELRLRGVDVEVLAGGDGSRIIEHHHAVVTEQDVRRTIRRSAMNRVIAAAAQHNVRIGGTARVNRVVTVVNTVHRGHAHDAASDDLGGATVAHEHVLTTIAIEHVVSRTTEEHVVAGSTPDDVVTTRLIECGGNLERRIRPLSAQMPRQCRNIGDDVQQLIA